MQINEWDSARLSIDPNREVRFGRRTNKLMLEGKEGSPGNYSLQLERCFTEVKHPRHTHGFEQVRLPIEGEFVYAKDKVLPTGWVGYFPAGSYYGPETRAPGTLMAVFQLGGASGHGYLSKEQREAAYDILVKKGKFDLERGVYTYYDEKGGKHNQDAQEAVWELATGHKVKYPQPRYNDIIAMNPDNFNWVEKSETPGIAYKWMGTFTEANTRVGFIRIDSGATLTTGIKDQRQALFLTEGSVNCNGRVYAKHSAFGLEIGETLSIKGEEPSQFLCVLLPQV